MPITSNFQPPYLDYGVPADLKKIQAELAAIWKSLPPRRATMQMPSTVMAATRNPRGSIDTGTAKLPLADLEPRLSRAVEGGAAIRSIEPGKVQAVTGQSFASGPRGQFELKGAGDAGASPAKSAASLVAVAPNGVVPVGFNCSKSFTATASDPGFLVSHVVWRMLLKNKGPGEDQLYYMGWTNSWLDPKPFPITATFSHKFETYSMMAYTSPANTVQFVIECIYYPDDPAVSNRTERSAWVTLDFNTPSCLSIHSVAVDKDTFVGGKNEGEPTLTVALDKPAGPSGQKVALSTTNRLGRILHTPDFPGSFVIPAGRTSGSVSWFLGTERVLTTGKSFHIKATLVSPGGQSNEGVVEIYLTKMK